MDSKMQQFNFKKGDVVTIKSGSPTMTIEGFNYSRTNDTGTPHYSLIWFCEQTNDFKTATISEGCLSQE